ncbi:MAG: MoxR family ATPase [Candidatus Spechtbacterales bacterium]|nr:MoxR family ATPase [Candidatus Spechtbacterales bacterium]
MTKSLKEYQVLVSLVKAEVEKRVFGMDDVLETILIGLFAPQGHTILQGVPGTAKTRLLKALAETVDVPFERIQMTVDLLPADIIGQEVYDPSTRTMGFRNGPLLQAGILLADELNRATPKTKSATLEAMAERQVTLTVHTEDGSSERTIPLPEVFTVFATQNPLEQMGTYPLAEAERDRFLMKKIVNYVSEEDEIRIASLPSFDEPLRKILTEEDILEIRSLIWKEIYIDENLIKKMVQMVRMTRPDEFSQAAEVLKIGASPRASQALVRATKVLAFLRGREFVSPRDVMDLAYSIFCHRVIFKSQQKEKWDEDLRNLLHGIYADVFGG